MKKIMFNDKYGLTQAVLDGRKTMTRREVKIGMVSKIALDLFKGVNDGAVFKIMIDKRAHYKVGEVVAIAQSYKAMTKGGYLNFMLVSASRFKEEFCGAGYTNKMFVRAEFMPHHIRITNIRVERLQDISDEDCLREGIIDNNDIIQYQVLNNCFFSPREAFAYLIDKVSGKGTWERNPYVFVYEFEKVD